MNQRHLFLTIGTLSPVTSIMHREDIIIPDEPDNPRKAAEILTEAVAEVYSVDPENLYWAIFNRKNDDFPFLWSKNIFVRIVSCLKGE